MVEDPEVDNLVVQLSIEQEEEKQEVLVQIRGENRKTLLSPLEALVNNVKHTC